MKEESDITKYQIYSNAVTDNGTKHVQCDIWLLVAKHTTVYNTMTYFKCPLSKLICVIHTNVRK